MAKTILITAKENAAKIVVDGNEIHDVLSYVLTEDADSAKLTLEIAITDEVEVRR